MKDNLKMALLMTAWAIMEIYLTLRVMGIDL